MRLGRYLRKMRNRDFASSAAMLSIPIYKSCAPRAAGNVENMAKFKDTGNIDIASINALDLQST
jgi:hypothetical protein